MTPSRVARSSRAPAAVAAALLAAFGGSPPANGHDAARAAARPVPAAGAPAPATLRLRLPDLPVVDQDGRRLRFAPDAVGRGRVVIAPFYAACDSLCPLTAAVMQALQDALAAAGRRDVRLVSVTVDPGRDGPGELARQAREYGAGEAWRLVTGELPDMLALLDALGIPYAGAPESHPPLFLLGDAASGRFFRLEGLPAPETLVALLDRLPP